MASSQKIVMILLLCGLAAVAVDACLTRSCDTCNPFGPYWNGQGCGKGSNMVFKDTMPRDSNSTTCCDTCADDPCCLFWVYNPVTKDCSGYTNCNRLDNQPTVREWFGDWKNISATCKGYSRFPDAQIGFPGFFNESRGKNYTVGENPQVNGTR
ncbi:hypothetical protein KFL_000030450 [Klebsormidium nitens]|uniref:Apple domain-containing protein n=1 Tax=Klebsormidium nitens TaxID=105231 RepID=A0A1Y1HMJ2_KLENI|nr:hypothetical protein KFL_000030450 [Klebsormidium nitens]|eukprot:GAQ77767.1 hypothetical protein KFL_000030450 [Klebsormidium nitens]